MKSILTAILVFSINGILSAQEFETIYGLYCASGKGLSCISLNDDSIAYNVSFSDGSFNDIAKFNYMIVLDTIIIYDYMDFYWHNNKLYWFNNEGEVLLKGGLKKVKERKLRKFQRKYKALLERYNLRFKNGLIESIE